MLQLLIILVPLWPITSGTSSSNLSELVGATGQEPVREPTDLWVTATRALRNGDRGALNAALDALAPGVDATEDKSDDFMLLSLRIEAGSANADAAHSIEQWQAQLTKRTSLIQKASTWLRRHDVELERDVAASFWCDLAKKRQRAAQLEGEFTVSQSDDGSAGEDASKEIERYLAAARRCDPQSAGVLATTARIQLVQGKCALTELEALVEQALAIDSEHPEALLVRACIHLCKGEEFIAKQAINRAIATGKVSDASALAEVARLSIHRSTPTQINALLHSAALLTDHAELWFRYADGRLRLLLGAPQMGASPLLGGMTDEVVDRLGQLGESQIAGLTAAFEKGRNSRDVRMRREASLVLGALTTLSGDAVEGKQSLARFLASRTINIQDWHACLRILEPESELSDTTKLKVISALAMEQLERADPGNRWPALAVLGYAFGREGDRERARAFFVDAYEDLEGDLTELPYIDELRRAAHRDGRSWQSAEAFDRSVDEGLTPAMQERIKAARRTTEREVWQKWAASSSGSGGWRSSQASTYSANENAYWEMVEYFDYCASSPLASGGVPTARWMNSDMSTQTFVIGSQATLSW